MIRPPITQKLRQCNYSPIYIIVNTQRKERYCINSAAIRFIPKEKLAEEGYGEYEYLFEK